MYDGIGARRSFVVLENNGVCRHCFHLARTNRMLNSWQTEGHKVQKHLTRVVDPFSSSKKCLQTHTPLSD